jgi:hypothetical protein
MTETETDLIELATRQNAGVEVRLLWNKNADELTVAVVDDRTGEAFEIPIPGENALDAFYHPFVYAPS